MLETLTQESWSECLGGSFELLDDGRGTIIMMLAEVTGLGRGAPGRRDPYSLVFRGPHRPSCRSGSTASDTSAWAISSYSSCRSARMARECDIRRYSPDARRVASQGFPVFLLFQRRAAARTDTHPRPARRGGSEVLAQSGCARCRKLRHERPDIEGATAVIEQNRRLIEEAWHDRFGKDSAF